MRSVKELRKREADRADKKARIYSTSEGRANFAEALESAQLENAVIGFDRYGRPLAALVSIDAVRMLANLHDDVEPAVREKITRMARLFLHTVPAKSTLARSGRKLPPTKKKAAKPVKVKKSRA
jgi:hypothetical protein